MQLRAAEIAELTSVSAVVIAHHAALVAYVIVAKAFEMLAGVSALVAVAVFISVAEGHAAVVAVALIVVVCVRAFNAAQGAYALYPAVFMHTAVATDTAHAMLIGVFAVGIAGMA